MARKKAEGEEGLVRLVRPDAVSGPEDDVQAFIRKRLAEILARGAMRLLEPTGDRAAF